MSDATPGRREGVPPVLVGLLLVVVSLALDLAWVLVPWTAAPALVDTTAGLPAQDVEAVVEVAAALRLPGLMSLLAGLVATAVVVASRPGRRALAAVRRVPGGLHAQVVAQVLVVLVVVLAVRWPFGVWAELVRRDAGLSVQGWGGWARDRLVSAGFGAVLITGVVLSLVVLARALPRWWPAVAAGAGAVTVVVLSLLYPVVVEPALAQLRPLPDGSVREQVQQVAELAGAPVADVLVSDASARTTSLNAYVSGLGPTRRVVLQDTLLSTMPQEQVLGVVAHETAHAASGDVLRGTALGALGVASLVLLLGTAAVSATARRPRWGRGVGEASAAGAVVAVVVAVQVLAAPVESLVSRQIERAADVRAVELTRDPDAYAGAMRTLLVSNRADPSPPPWYQWWFGSHPTGAERVARAEATAP